MASLISSPAPPLHVQHLEKALRLDPFFRHVEGVFSDPFLASLSDTDDSEVGDLGKTLPEGIRPSLVNGDVSDSGSLINGCLRPEELHVDKSRLYNFTKVKKDRRWLKEMLLSDSSSSSDEDQPMTDEDLHEMLWLHKQQKLARQRFLRGGELLQYQHYSASLLYTQDKYHDSQKQRGNAKKLKKKKMKDGSLKIVKVKKEKMRIKKKRKKSEDQSDGDRRESGTIDERLMKRTLIRRKEADAKRRKLWALICRKEIPRTQRQKSSARNNTLSNAKKLAQLCQKERRREAQRSQKIAQQTVPRARRLVREMMVYWKKYEKVEKEHRKRVEKEAMEQRKLDDELREARRQQRKLNFLITQTELYAHFMGKKLKGNKMSASSDVQHILSKLDEPSDKSKIKSVSGGVLIDMENSDNYDARAMKMEALANAENAFRLQEAKRQAFDVNSQESGGSKKIALSQESFDVNFSLANPNISGEDHPQPNLFQGKLKTYQLKGMNWLISLYEQGISGILADEMGLGKTVQSIAFLSYLAETHNIWGPFLVVAPASTLHNWQQEVSRFIPQFKVLPYWGNQGDRKSLRKFWSQKQTHISDRNHAPFHLLITSYQLVVQDVRYFQRIKWQYIVLDEAQAIKSSSSVRWKILLGYQCRNRLLLTGTPIQNSMAELWALLHFIMPTLFDNHEEFNEWFSKDIESHAENKSLIDQNQLSRLHMILKPFMLRRIKKDVENELSEKIEIKLVCGLTTRQKWLYQAVKQKISIDDLVYTSASSSATSATTSSLMNLVMQFRKVCNHPELFERRDVTSPVTVQLPPYVIPKLIYRKGITSRMSPFRTKILRKTLNIWRSDYISSSLNCSSRQRVPESECFSFLRFAGISLEEASMMMLGSPSHRLLLLLILLRKVMLLHHKRSWSPSKSSSRLLGKDDLILWPSWPTSFSSVHSSTTLSGLVFTGYTRPFLSHVTEHIRPIVTEEERQLTKRKPPVASPLSPTNRNIPHHKPVTPTSPLKHSTSGPFSPPRHHGHGGLEAIQTSKHQQDQHHHHHHHHHHRHHKHRSSSGHSTTEASGRRASDHSHEMRATPLDRHGIAAAAMKYPQTRNHRPLDASRMLMVYMPKVVAVCELSYCSDRSAAYEHQELARGGPDESRNLLLYGAPEAVDMKEYRAHLFPPPLGGLEATQPSKGWSFVQMPNRNSVISDSGKLTVLDGLLTKLKLQGHRVLIYSQMTRMIDILEEYMTFRKHKYMRLDGSSKISDRRDMVADFQNNKDIFVFLLSTRAGGLGINLTAADTVIFYDSDWNPTVDEQAMDRAHRLGQTKQVTVYRLVTKNTIEERILQRAREKSEIQKMVISGGNFKPDALKPKEVVSLLLDDEELENKFLQRQAEKKADEQRKRRERKRKKGGTDEGTSSPSIEISETSTPPPKAKKGRKSKSSLFPPAPEGVPTASVPPSEASSVNGDASARLEGADADDISVMSLDEISMVSGDGSLYSMDAPPSSSATPFNEDSLLGDAEPKSETASPSTAEGKRGRGRGRARGRGRNRGRGTAPIRTSRGRGRGRGGTGVMAASAAASAAAAAASAAAYAAYGFTFQGTPTPPPPAARSSPVAFGSGGSTVPGSAVTHPVPRYDNSSANSSPARHRDVEN
ncbi:chromatin-remodeling ATPase INO80 isoform X2 [Nematostella vectensis]|uniref:chromatin-remodeling ATPase INO80 isoform X2 n=1 Tax=Nematostella vectensis TaxID=45351 RepID=UPI0020776456|nr:chromatin-remodeling ATPase INO80 isoform X2 [Nematostella vectensis]